ncbi:receptor-type tyrosine-protein phosphatase N2 [Daktulosphaira vitifoliae]|uniref:receptor-type tyrosine-protein phosphatase N2 n=1 Tax=Daktulosphaira vitifoliae TaxID=58002 RepID=UPI0021A9E914|nr:receptor-type tyrosine-protein phosphatase N2 [Daktulosphaira vitifoliae]
MIGSLLRAALISIFLVTEIKCDRNIGWTPIWQKYTGCLFNRNVCTKQEWCFDDHAFGQCVSKWSYGDQEYMYKLLVDNLMVLRDDMLFLYRNGYTWTHPYTQCILQYRLKSIKFRTSVDISACDQYSKINDNTRFDDEEIIDVPSQPDFYMEPMNVAQNYEGQFYVDTGDDYDDIANIRVRPKSIRNKLQGTPLYLPWMPDGNPYENEVIDEKYGQVRFRQNYNMPNGFRSGKVKDKMINEWNELRRMDLAAKDVDGSDKAYTEGGLVFLPRKGLLILGANEIEDDEFLNDFLKSYNPDLGWGFKRPERLDVKKPGPFFKTNNYAFINNDSDDLSQGEDITKTVDASTLLGTIRKSGFDDDDKPKENRELVKSTQNDFKTVYYSKIAPDKINSINQKENKPKLIDDDHYDIVDTSYVYIQIKELIKSEKRAHHLLETLAKIIMVNFKSFINIHVNGDEITFKLLPSSGFNTSDIIKKIESAKEKFYQKSGFTIISVGIGDKTKLPSVMMKSTYEESKNFEWIFISVAIMCAAAVSALGLILMKRHTKIKDKFEGLIESAQEVTKDYQELCRARMSNKKEEPSVASQRIASLSKDPDNSPSSRSSTSSWGEEPVLSNMDISTGHMVLAYMEDHLNNKNRLDSEWAALCAYEAEPCAITIGRKPENAKKNRYINAIPYDHARVVINEYANMNNSDYINASTITDHDPRNPAYIATQGPLPETSAEFWQMVWEQGCVVIVMLTRLVENDVTLCHRYWPEEGSELYHIYEVHLVSEHIWCDDYLVRSFYLKNLKTGETRTVTQFHFLTWPDGGVPNTTKALLEFRRKVNKSFRGRSCPIVVHCSDGVSRTGSYCLLDMVLNRMAKGAKEIDIAATLEHIRDQRSGAVATKAQFQMVLAAVAEEVQAILKALPQQQQTPQPIPPPPPPAQH